MDNDNLVRQARRVRKSKWLSDPDDVFPWPGWPRPRPRSPSPGRSWPLGFPTSYPGNIVPPPKSTTDAPSSTIVPATQNVPIAPDPPPNPTPQPPPTTIKTPTTTSESNMNTILIGIGVVILFIIIAALVYFFLIREEKPKGKPTRRTRTRKTGKSKSKSKSKTGTSKSSVSHASSPVSKTNSPMAKSPLDLEALPENEKSSVSKVQGSSKINKTVKNDPEGAEAETAVAAAESQDPNSGIQSVAFGNYKTKIAPSYRIEKAKRT